MKPRLLEILACPACGRPRPELRTPHCRAGAPPEIDTGALVCPGCGKVYPITGSIPRLLPDSFADHRADLAAWLPEAKGSPRDEEEIQQFRSAQGATRESFGFEWLRYDVTGFAENLEFFRRSTGLGCSDLKGKLVLDAGCGMGRFLEVAASEGAEVVGMDLSRAVERAHREAASPDRAHFVQADIMRPPFAPGSFDVIYSIGVLHHTVNTHQAFRALCPLLRPGGRIAIWVYRQFQPELPVGIHKRVFELLSQVLSDGTRAVTTRLPHRLLHDLCYAAIPLGYLKHTVSQHPVLKYTLWPALLPPVSDHPDWRVRLCDTFDWLSPRYQWKHTTREVTHWFEEAGLRDVHALDKPVSVTGIRPE